MQFGLLWNKAAQVGLHSDVILVIVVQSALRQTLVNRSKSLGLLVETSINCRDVTHVERHGCFGSPTTLTVEVGHSQLIHPNDATLARRRIVAHTDEYHPDFA